MADLNAICTDGSIRYLDMQLKGAATGVLLFFLLNIGVCFSEEDLQFYTGYSRPTLHRALRSLARYELVQQLGERPVWSLTAHVKQLTFVGDLAGVDEKKFFSPSSSSSILEDQKLLLTTTARSEKSFSDCHGARLPRRQEQAPRNTRLATRLQQAGVFAGPTRELAADPWVTEERVEAWVSRLEGDRRVRSVGAVLYTNLRNHLEPGPKPQEKRPGAIEICPRCSAHPCMCEEFGLVEEG